MRWKKIFTENELEKAIEICEIKINEFINCKWHPDKKEYKTRIGKIRSNSSLTNTDITELWCFYENHKEYPLDNLYIKLNNMMKDLRKHKKITTAKEHYKKYREKILVSSRKWNKEHPAKIEEYKQKAKRRRVNDMYR